jgi:hypothetical protein
MNETESFITHILEILLYGEGAAIKELVVTLVLAATPDIGRDAARLSTIDTISVSGRTQVPQVPAGLSVYSLCGSTGEARRVQPVATNSVRRGSGTPATQNRIFDNFRQVLPTSVQQPTTVQPSGRQQFSYSTSTEITIITTTTTTGSNSRRP